jgi:hypothetical protein
MNQNPCLPCIPAKKNNPKLEKSSRSHLSDIQVGELLSGDIIGKWKNSTTNQEWRYLFYLFLNKKSGCWRKGEFNPITHYFMNIIKLY